MSKNGYFWAAIAAVALMGSVAFAQGEGAQGAESSLADPPFEFGIHTGNLLPNQINGVTEIMGLGGVRTAFRMSPRSYVEGGFITGNGEGQQWRNIHADIRMDSPVESYLASVYIGGDAVYYKGVGRSEVLNFGGHVGGAVQAQLTSAAWFRADMKFGFSPGTSLYFSLGFVWRLGASGGAGAGN